MIEKIFVCFICTHTHTHTHTHARARANCLQVLCIVA